MEGPEGVRQVPESFRNPSWKFQRAQPLSWREWREGWQYQGLKQFLHGFEIQIKLYLSQEMKTFKILSCRICPEDGFFQLQLQMNHLNLYTFFYFLILKCLALSRALELLEEKAVTPPSADGIRLTTTTLPHSQHPESTHKIVHVCVALRSYEWWEGYMGKEKKNLRTFDSHKWSIWINVS